MPPSCSVGSKGRMPGRNSQSPAGCSWQGRMGVCHFPSCLQLGIIEACKVAKDRGAGDVRYNSVPAGWISFCYPKSSKPRFSSPSNTAPKLDRISDTADHEAVRRRETHRGITGRSQTHRQMANCQDRVAICTTLGLQANGAAGGGSYDSNKRPSARIGRPSSH